TAVASALEALRGHQTLQNLAQKYGLAPSKTSSWLQELEMNAIQAFDKSSMSDKELKRMQSENQCLLQKVGQFAIDCDFFAKACEASGLKVR
ncbi:hypothetical protein T235_00355, partial [Tannerella sp. oral taxon BU063 isolate Cell 8/11]